MPNLRFAAGLTPWAAQSGEAPEPEPRRSAGAFWGVLPIRYSGAAGLNGLGQHVQEVRPRPPVRSCDIHGAPRSVGLGLDVRACQGLRHILLRTPANGSTGPHRPIVLASYKPRDPA